jgi:ketosteroid isomerase-like protein
MSTSHPTPASTIDRLFAATNAHDLEALVACFAPDYVNETPAHPQRGFSGREQVRRNWSQLFAAMPDLVFTESARVVDGDDVWAEVEMRGTRPDASQHLSRGVLVFTVRDGLARRLRFYVEPVDPTGSTVDDAVRAAVTGGAP